MKNINLVTPPDKLYNNNLEILLVYPSVDIQNQLLDQFLSSYKEGVNVYLFDDVDYKKEHVAWVLDVFKSADIVIVNVDNCEPFFKDMLSYMISNDKTHWLTNSSDSIFSHISNKRIYNLDWLNNLGTQNAETE